MPAVWDPIGEPLESAKPISRCGPVEMPTIPGPTELITWPAPTCEPTGSWFAGPANQLPVGSHVGAGQVMSSIGPGIVGISTGPHLEIGFADSSGSPIGGGSASTMMSLLQGAYGG